MKKIHYITFFCLFNFNYSLFSKECGLQTKTNDLFRTIQQKKELIRKKVLEMPESMAYIEYIQRTQEKIHDLEDHIGRTDEDGKSINQLQYKIEKIRYQKCLLNQKGDQKGICKLHEEQQKIAQKIKEKRKSYNIDDKLNNLYRQLYQTIEHLDQIFQTNNQLQHYFMELYVLQDELSLLIPCPAPQRVFIASWERFFMQ